MEENIFFIFLN